MPRSTLKTNSLLCLMVLLSSAATGLAGSPFITDDPAFEKGWETKVASIYEKFFGEDTLTAPLLDLNYAPTHHVQLNVTAAQKTVFVRNAPDQTGFSDMDLKVKWRVLDEQETVPAFSIAPALTLPTASARKGLGDEVWRTRLTAQVAKTFGRFYTYAEGGFQYAFGDHDHLLYGYVLQYDLTDRWNVGVEISGNMPLVGVDNHGVVANIGLSYAVRDDVQLQVSVGRTLRDESHGGAKLLLQFFLQWTF